MIIDRINNWFKVSKQYFFTYSNGFFNLSYLSNSPEVIVKSCIKLPFMKHDSEKQMLYADTPFLKGEFCYSELEHGLWVFSSIMEYKNNVAYKPVYDKFLPADYYCVTINFIENELYDRAYEFNNVKITNHSLSFSKPGTDFINCHFKGSKETMYMLYFSEEWADKNITNSTSISQSVHALMEDKQKDFLNYSIIQNEFQPLVDHLQANFDQVSKPNIFELKKLSYEFLTLFFSSLEMEDNFNSNQLSHGDRIKIQKIEHHLSRNLYQKFPGIDVLSEKFKISPTRLKQNFKILYGVPIFAYFQNAKMKMALYYIEKTELKIKDIALKFDYENVGKFSKAFQKCHGQLPSKHRS